MVISISETISLVESTPNIVELDDKKVTGITLTLTTLNTCMKHVSKLQQKQLPQFHHPRVLFTDSRLFHSLQRAVPMKSAATLHQGFCTFVLSTHFIDNTTGYSSTLHIGIAMVFCILIH